MKLKMFVWVDVLTNYTSGMMVALAHNVEEARTLLLAKCPHLPPEDLAKFPYEITKPEAFIVSGGA